MARLQVKKDDIVVVISGKDKGKKGKVLIADLKNKRVIIEKVNMLTKHQKPKGKGQPGGLMHQEGPISSDNVMLLCAKCSKATRIAYRILEDGKKLRVCKKCGETFDK